MCQHKRVPLLCGPLKAKHPVYAPTKRNSHHFFLPKHHLVELRVVFFRWQGNTVFESSQHCRRRINIQWKHKKARQSLLATDLAIAFLFQWQFDEKRELCSFHKFSVEWIVIGVADSVLWQIKWISKCLVDKYLKFQLIWTAIGHPVAISFDSYTRNSKLLVLCAPSNVSPMAWSSFVAFRGQIRHKGKLLSIFVGALWRTWSKRFCWIESRNFKGN